MKKSLIALAVLGAAASAQAADISLYGVVDTGLAYTYEDNWGFNLNFARASSILTKRLFL